MPKNLEIWTSGVLILSDHTDCEDSLLLYEDISLGKWIIYFPPWLQRIIEYEIKTSGFVSNCYLFWNYCQMKSVSYKMF